MSKTLTVAAVEKGTVIDHIPHKKALNILRFLQSHESAFSVHIGLNLSSKKIGRKDLIKIHHRKLTKKEMDHIALFVPNCTINIIENFEVIEKIFPELPEKVVGVFRCLNPCCVTNHEKTTSQFFIDKRRKDPYLTCMYCQNSFPKETIEEIF